MGEKIRVLHIITVFSVGGATETVVSLVKGLRDERCDVAVVAGPPIPSEGSMLPIAQAAGIDVAIIPELTRNIHPVRDLLALFSLTRLIRKGRFDIVHTHSSKAGVLGRLAARLAGTRHIIHTVHGLPFHQYQNSLWRSMYILVERFCARFTSKLVAVSHRIVFDSLQARIGNKDQFMVIRSGFNTKEFEKHSEPDENLKRQLGIQDGNFVIGKISRLSLLKGHSALITILPNLIEEFPHLKVLFVGDGEMRIKLVEEVKQRGLQNHVIFVGSIPPTELPRYLSVIDLVIHTSLHEGLARVLPQALVMGKPVISYYLDGSQEVIRHGCNGLLVPPLEPESLTEAIRRIIHHYDSFAKSCVAAKHEVIREFDERKMVEDVSMLYRESVGEASK